MLCMIAGTWRAKFEKVISGWWRHIIVTKAAYTGEEGAVKLRAELAVAHAQCRMPRGGHDWLDKCAARSALQSA